jgi:uncharacterized membrane protein
VKGAHIEGPEGAIARMRRTTAPSAAAIPRSLSARPSHAAWARVEGGARAGIQRGEGVARSRQGATAIEGTSCGPSAKLEGAAVVAYAE